MKTPIALSFIASSRTFTMSLRAPRRKEADAVDATEVKTIHASEGLGGPNPSFDES